MIEQKTLAEIVRRVVEIAQPEKIILFGSAARGDMGPNSDVDLLISKEGRMRSTLWLGSTGSARADISRVPG